MVLPVSNSGSSSVQKRSRRIDKRQRKQKLQKDRTAEQRLVNRTSGGNPCMSAMSAWAENFTSAATWQLKHQLAYWKAKAVALQYENSVLHEVIQKNLSVVPTTSGQNKSKLNNGDLHGTSRRDIKSEDLETEESDTECTESESSDDDDDNQNYDDEEDLEVSPEFVEFLAANAKYREDARRERERLKAAYEEKYVKEEAKESIEDKIARKKELYGDKYQKIVALEMYQMSDFKNGLDKLKPEYWPNIPLNL